MSPLRLERHIVGCLGAGRHWREVLIDVRKDFSQRRSAAAPPPPAEADAEHQHWQLHRWPVGCGLVRPFPRSPLPPVPLWPWGIAERHPNRRMIASTLSAPNIPIDPRLGKLRPK